ncbi:MAG: AraC family transcriptional regulator [Acidobacteria bacterium]|nr:AraC family transcriptional regulator [Acidobacteriota bacterium]
MTEDVLSDVLRAVRLTGAVYFDYELSSPWVAEAPPSREIAAAVIPGAQRVIEYHLVARGACWAHVLGQESVRLGEGDLILFPQGDPHVLASAPGLRATPDLAMYARSSAPLPLVFERGGGGPQEARVICGFLGCDDRPFNPLLDALPRMLHVSSAVAGDGWIRTLLMTAVEESRGGRPGAENILSRLSELMFVETIRRYLERLPEQAGWLAGLRDALVGRALAAIHAAPGEPWTVDRLARRVGASRSVLAERFAALVGQPPMHYLTMWRMQLASRQLLGGAPIAEVAPAVGYESEAAFSRAFKKIVGQAPATWRRSAGVTRG